MGNPMTKMFDICCNNNSSHSQIIRSVQRKDKPTSLVYQESIKDLQEMHKVLLNKQIRIIIKRKIKEGILVIRFEVPFHVRCNKCKNMIGKGVRFNAEKKCGN